MKKLTVMVVLVALFAVLLVVLAFLYIDISGHHSFQYEMLVGGKSFAFVKVDRYVTENKIVYKEHAKYPHSLGYPEVTEKLFLDKRTKTPLKFVKESQGIKGQKRLTHLEQKGEECDFLFVEHPSFLALEDFSTGENTMVFSPEDVMSYMPIIERYNFWKKGAQFFEIMIPVDKALPPMRDKLGVRYLNEEYIPVMGRKVEAYGLVLDAGSIPEITVYVSKYSHRVLTVYIEDTNTYFELVNMTESTAERIKPLVNKVVSLMKKDDSLEDKENEVSPDRGTDEIRSDEAKEIFFESGKLVLSGKVWQPEGDGVFPTCIIIPGDGPQTRGEEQMASFIGRYLSENGFLVLTFDSPGQGKSQGSFNGLTDKRRMEDILSSVEYLKTRADVKKDSITLIGHGGGGYVALRAAEKIPEVKACVLLGMPIEGMGTEFMPDVSRETLEKELNALGFGAFDKGFLKTVSEKLRAHTEKVNSSKDNISFFLGVQMPLEEFKYFLARTPYETMLDFDKPLLVIYGKDSKSFNQQAVDKLQKVLGKSNENNKVAVFRDLGAYAGKMVESGDSWRFSANNAVLELLKEWIRDNGTHISLPDPALSVAVGEKTALEEAHSSLDQGI